MEFHPVDRLRDRFQNIAAHPFQTAMRMGAGALAGPAGNALAGALFGAYNRRQDANSAQGVADRTVQQGNQAGQRGFDRPLGGQLGQFDSFGRGGGNTNLANAMMGSYGGTTDARGGAYNMAQQFGRQAP